MKKIILALMCVAMIFSLVSCTAMNTGTSGDTEVGALEMLASFLPLLLVIVVFYFFMLRPQKKQDKEIADMRDSIALGDIIITKGGIVGRVVRIKDDMMLIETGGNKTRIQILKNSVSEIKAKANADSDGEN